jgi:hypothetical protein
LGVALPRRDVEELLAERDATRGGRSTPGRSSRTEGPFLAHWPCHDLFVALAPNTSWLWAELSRFMTQLIVNGQVELSA